MCFSFKKKSMSNFVAKIFAKNNDTIFFQIKYILIAAFNLHV